MSTRRLPLLTVALLGFTAAVGIVGFSIGINAFAQAKDDKSHVRSLAPAGVTVDIDDSDVLAAGAVFLAGSGLIAVVSIAAIGLLLLRRATPKPSLFGSLLVFLSVWVLATAIALVVLITTKGAKVEAFLGGRQLPDSLVRLQEQQAGVSREYWSHWYLRILAIWPFPVFFFGLLSAFSLYRVPTEEPVQTRTMAQVHEKKEGSEHRTSDVGSSHV